MMWQKELVDGESIYVKLMKEKEQKVFSKDFSKRLQTFMKEKLFLKKSNALSQKIREVGNETFKLGLFTEANGLYTKAITLAENDSEELAFCYANRSLGFLKLEKYASCLADIELATKNKYPASLMPKLERRKVACMRLRTAKNNNDNGDEESQRELPKLSYKADEQIPCFANGLKINFSDKYGNHITTNRDLEIGQTVIVERAFIFEATDTFYSHCENCLKRTTNLIPCNKCVIATFCSEECRAAANEKYHDVLCVIENICEFPIQQLLMQSIIIAIKEFSTCEALMAAVEQFRAQNNNGINYSDPRKRNFFQLFKLDTKADKISVQLRKKFKKDAMTVVEILTRHSSVRAMFRSIKMARFLSHLALHLMHVIHFNGYRASHAICSPTESVLGIKECTCGTSFGIGVTPYSSQMSHSCAPNICRIFINDTVIYKVIRPIKSGEQLFISYMYVRWPLSPIILNNIKCFIFVFFFFVLLSLQRTANIDATTSRSCKGACRILFCLRLRFMRIELSSVRSKRQSKSRHIIASLDCHFEWCTQSSVHRIISRESSRNAII